MQDLFADRLGNATIAGGVARLDFLRLESIDRARSVEEILNPVETLQLFFRSKAV